VTATVARSCAPLLQEIEMSRDTFDMSDCLPQQSQSSAATRLQHLRPPP
jgi:hypothetical protein